MAGAAIGLMALEGDIATHAHVEMNLLTWPWAQECLMATFILCH
jgi:hypothetical protein